MIQENFIRVQDKTYFNKIKKKKNRKKIGNKTFYWVKNKETNFSKKCW